MEFITKDKTNIKYLLIVIVLAAAVAGGIVSYLGCVTRELIFLNQYPQIGMPEKTEDETANWKTYKNEGYGFEMKHPKEWEIEETNCIFFEDNTFRICINTDPTLDACIIPACSSEASIKIAGIEANKTISAIWGWIGYDEEGYGRVTYDDGEISCREVRDRGCIPCEKEKKMSKEECEKLPHRINIASQIPFKDGFLAFSFLCPDWRGTEGINECDQLYNQILSTFRFIEEDETANWKTYRNEEYGFEIKYPKDWSMHEFSEQFVSFCPPGKKPAIEYPGEITVNIQQLDFQKWIEERTQLGIFRNKKDITMGIGNYNGIEVQDLGIVNFRSILLAHNSNVYSIYINEDSSEMPIFNQMLSTFQFLE